MKSQFTHYVIVLAATMMFSDAARPAPPRVRFDVSSTVECRDVTSGEFLAANPDERLVEAKFQVSSLIADGSEDDLIQYFYRIESPHGGVRIVDYSPQTTLAPNHAGNITIEKQEGLEHTLGATVPIPNEFLPKANGTAGITKTNCTKTHYDLLPPLDLLAASGTIHRGTGVYFKLKPSDRTTLEGGKEFVVVARVPAAWRADLMHIHCRAVGNDRGIVRSLDEPSASGSSDFVVALYQSGDYQAKADADRYVDLEWQLRRVANAQQDEINKRMYPTTADKLQAFFVKPRPKIPENWLNDVVFGPPNGLSREVVAQLPKSIQTQTSQYLAAKSILVSHSKSID